MRADALRKLADEVERLRPDQCPSREHDALIWIAIDGFQAVRVMRAAGTRTYRDFAPPYTANDADRASAVAALRARAQEAGHEG